MVSMGGEAGGPAMGCFRVFVWHLSLSVVAAREHLWRSSLRGVGGDSGECPMGGTASCSRAGMAALRCVMGLGFEGGGWGEMDKPVQCGEGCTALYAMGASYRRDDINWCWLQTSNL